MAKSEPSLVPEWLRGAGGSGHHGPLSQHTADGGPFFSRQRQGSHSGLHGDSSEFSRHGPASERTFFRRGGVGPSSSDRDGHLRESQGRTSYSSFNRGSYRGYDGPDRERDGRGPRTSIDRDRDYHRDREKERSSGFGSSDRLESMGSSLRHLSSTEGPTLRRSASSNGASRFQDDSRDTERRGSETEGIPVASSAGSTSSKAAFDRNFPSLNAVELQSSAPAQDAALSPVLRPRQLPRTVSASAIGAAGGSGDAWASVLADGQGTAGAAGAVVAPLSSAAQGLLGSSGGPLPAAGAVAPAAALDRVRAAPQALGETQRLEEMALKQSRQLVPMKPSMPKALTQGGTTRDKGKPKPGRLGEGPLLPPALISSAPASPTPVFRLSQGGRADTSKLPSGMLLARRLGKEGGVAAVTGSSVIRPEGGLVPLGPVPLGVSASSALSGPGVASTPAAVSPSATAGSGSGSRIRASQAPLGALSVGGGFTGAARAKDSSPGGGVEDKKGSLQTQNRSDFFNALRRKAAGGGTAVSNGRAAVAEKQGSADERETKEAGTEGEGSERETEGEELLQPETDSAKVDEQTSEMQPQEAEVEEYPENWISSEPIMKSSSGGNVVNPLEGSLGDSLEQAEGGKFGATADSNMVSNVGYQPRINGILKSEAIQNEVGGRVTENGLDKRRDSWERTNGKVMPAEKSDSLPDLDIETAQSLRRIGEDGQKDEVPHGQCAEYVSVVEEEQQSRKKDLETDTWTGRNGVARLQSDDRQVEQQGLSRQDGLRNMDEKGVPAESDEGLEPSGEDVGSMQLSLQKEAPSKNGDDTAAGLRSQGTSDILRGSHHTELGSVNAVGLEESPSSYVPSRAASLEEEEAAFLRSLGWTEEAEEGEENALTEEEINAFYKEAGKVAQRGQWQIRTAAFRASPHNFRAIRPPIRRSNGASATERVLVGSLGSLSSGMTSSDSESDDDHTFQPRRQQ